ncbi:MAG: HAD hydrolase family protein [Candidatus Yanofskybacteria bacterium]|nr:HAD hydrolase family protein [Candidatus Yanofskybacteria bacterium]
MRLGLEERIKKLKLVVFDFDGIFTDGKVMLDQNGIESVVCSRKDGMGILMLKQAGLKVIVITNEQNPVVVKRCAKLGVELIQTPEKKLPFFIQLLNTGSLNYKEVAFMGDDVNDLECLDFAGVKFTVADGDPKCKEIADYVTVRNGGDHAVREVCDLILRYSKPA